MGIHVTRVYGQCNHDEQVQELQNTRGCHILIATPGRLETFITLKWETPIVISLEMVKYFVLDEADFMLASFKSVYKDANSDTGSDSDSHSESDAKDSDSGTRFLGKSNFYYEVKKIVRHLPHKDSRQTMLFSASLPKKFQWYAQK